MRQPSTPAQRWAWWEAAVAGDAPPIHEDDPHAGFFAVRRFRYGEWVKGPMVPARIWWEPGEIDPETGEMPEGFEQARALVATKAQACAAFVLDNDAQADMVEQHAKALMERVKTARKRSAWLRECLQTHMSACGITEITSDDGTFKATLSIGRDESVEVFDAAQIPQDYMREIPAKYEPDKVLIKQALKDNFDVPGAKLVKRDRLTLK